jgi:phytol kinase
MFSWAARVLLLAPTTAEVLLFSAPIAGTVFACGYLAGWLKVRCHVRTNYTRKLFHVTLFTLGAVFGAAYGTRVAVLLGVFVVIYGIVAIARGADNIFYEGLAREQDAPHRTFYMIVPFIAAALGALVNNIAFPRCALIGYLVVGWGDAFGEPVGARFGKHRYPVPSFLGVRCTRSAEGTLAVFGATAIACFLAVWLLRLGSVAQGLWAALLIGATTTIVEALSPHGIDNFTTQVLAGALAWQLGFG